MIEIMIVIVIIGIIAAVGGPSMLSYLEYSSRMTCESYAETVISEVERYLVTAQYYERKDADKTITRTLERSSAIEITVTENEEHSRSTVIKTLSGEHYLIYWEFSNDDDISEFLIVCSEHDVEFKKSFKLSYVGGIGYTKPSADTIV